MKKVIYLASGRAKLNYPNVVYNDYKENRDLVCDMMDVDLGDYDILIATPPCNYYSRANYCRETSTYAQETKHLLPDIIDKFIKTGKPFIVENVRNAPLFQKLGLYNKSCLVYIHGRHTYWTNCLFDMSHIPQFEFFFEKMSKKCVKMFANVNLCDILYVFNRLNLLYGGIYERFFIFGH